MHFFFFLFIVVVVYLLYYICFFVRFNRSPELLTEKGVHGDYGYGFSPVARSGVGHNKRATINDQ